MYIQKKKRRKIIEWINDLPDSEFYREREGEQNGVDRSRRNERPGGEHARHEVNSAEGAPINSPRFIYLSNGPARYHGHLITTIYLCEKK